MRFQLILFFLLGLSFVGNFCKSPGKKEVIAWVNEKPIYLEEYQENLERNWMGSERESASEPSFSLKLKSLEGMIEESLILAEAQRLGIKLLDQEINSELEQLFGYTNAELSKKLVERGVSLERWKAQVAQELLVRKTLDTVFRYQIYISEQELKNYYEQHQKELMIPERARVRQILLSEEGTAQEVLKQLQIGADFKELARKYSKSPEAEKGGEIGWVERGQLPDDLERAIFTIKPGTISGLIKSPFGYHILWIEERSPARGMSFEEAKAQIEKLLTEERKKALYQVWIRELWKSNKIRINYQLL